MSMLQNDPFMAVSLENFHRHVVDAVRAAASQIADFKTGAIAVRYVALDSAAAAWLGRPEAYLREGKVNTTFIDSIVKGGSTTRPACWRDDPENEEVDCAGYVMLKLEGCTRAIIGNFGYCSDDLPDQFTIEGSVNGRGAMCFEIAPSMSSYDSPQLRIFVGVSGASGIEDKWCAFHALDGISSCLTNDTSKAVIRPTFNPNADEVISQLRLKASQTSH